MPWGMVTERVWLRRWLIAFVVIGLGRRLIRYALAMPVWGDEAAVGLNIIHRSYRELLDPLDYGQVAPLLFLWLERLAYQAWGMSEYALRFFPTLAGLAALALFLIWIRRWLEPLTATLAAGVMAVGYYSVRHAVELKPYSLDLCASLLLFWPATYFILERKRGWLALLIVVTPIAVALSYPAVLVGGGVAAAILWTSSSMSWRTRTLGLLYGLCLVISFLVVFVYVGRGQYEAVGPGMVDSWNEDFPPANPVRWPWWFVKAHTGRLFAYPVGDKNGGSTVSFILFTVGMVALARRRAGPLLCLLLAPFGLTLVAAALRRYPYGGHTRVGQHLAPVIVTLVALGISVLLERFAGSQEKRRKAAGAVFILLTAIGLGGLAGELIWPYRRLDDARVRYLTQSVSQRAGSDQRIVVLQPRGEVPIVFQWYLDASNGRVWWDGDRRLDWRAHRGGLYVINFEENPQLRSRLETLLGRRVSQQTVERLMIGPLELSVTRWEVLYFKAVPG